MIGYIILAAVVLILVLIVVIIALKNKSLKKEVAKDEAEIKFDDHLIHAMNDAIVEDGKITREANEKRNKNDKSDSAVAVTAELNSL